MLIENIRGKKVDKTDIKSMNLKELEELIKQNMRCLLMNH